MPTIDRAQRLLDIQRVVFEITLERGAAAVSGREAARRMRLSEGALRNSFRGDLAELGVRWVERRQRLRFMIHDADPAGTAPWAISARFALRFLPVDQDRLDDAVVWTRLIDGNHDRPWASRRAQADDEFVRATARAITPDRHGQRLLVLALHGAVRAAVTGACTPAEVRAMLIDHFALARAARHGHHPRDAA